MEEMIYNNKNFSVTANPPAVEVSNKIRELFKLDPKLKLTYSDATKTVSIISTDLKKATAVRYILPEYNGCVINVYYAIGDEKILLGRPGGYHHDANMIVDAFDGNPLWVYIHTWNDKRISNEHCWAGFIAVPVVYPNDDLENLYGEAIVLPVDLAKDVLDTHGIHYCSYNENRTLIRDNTKANYLYKDQIDWYYKV